MKLKRIILASALVAATTAPVMAQEVLTGDTRLACEAILCLSSGTRPNECTPALKRFFSISLRRWSDTLRGRINFLNMCPAANMSTSMQNLVNAIGSGAGRCDASSLNATMTSWNAGDSGANVTINNQMPEYCSAYASHSYTDLKETAPKYVGTPERGGYWVEAVNYTQELAEYNQRLAAEDAAPRDYSGNR